MAMECRRKEYEKIEKENNSDSRPVTIVNLRLRWPTLHITAVSMYLDALNKRLSEGKLLLQFQ